MEARFGKLEEHIGKLREDMATVKERLNHVPTKTWLLASVLSAAGITILALLAIKGWLVQQYLGPILQHLGK